MSVTSLRRRSCRHGGRVGGSGRRCAGSGAPDSGDIAVTSALKVMIAFALTGCLCLDSRAFLFGDDFNRAYGWVVDSGNEGDLDLSLRRRFDMLERLNQGAGASRTEDIESSYNNVDPLQ